MYITMQWLVLDMFSDLHIPLNVVWYLVYNEYYHGTPQVTVEQIITIIHLGLQVYCSPSLKEHLHNPVMSLLTRSMQRKESILHAHGGVCALHVCVVVCDVCCMWVCGCVVVCICICVIISASAFRMQVYVHVSVITQVQ